MSRQRRRRAAGADPVDDIFNALVNRQAAGVEQRRRRRGGRD
jgi:hypothetical protein